MSEFHRILVTAMGVCMSCFIVEPARLQAAAGRRPDITAVEALDRYTAVQDKVRPSFVLKTRVTHEDRDSSFVGTKTRQSVRYVEDLARERFSDPEERAQFAAERAGRVDIYRRNMMGDSGTCSFDAYMWTKLYGDSERTHAQSRSLSRL